MLLIAVAYDWPATLANDDCVNAVACVYSAAVLHLLLAAALPSAAQLSSTCCVLCVHMSAGVGSVVCVHICCRRDTPRADPRAVGSF